MEVLSGGGKVYSSCSILEDIRDPGTEGILDHNYYYKKNIRLFCQGIAYILAVMEFKPFLVINPNQIGEGKI